MIRDECIVLCVICKAARKNAYIAYMHEDATYAFLRDAMYVFLREYDI